MGSTTSGPVCPKCGSDMQPYERNGITIDQCTGCRGIFLDRGELERLVDAEAAYAAAPPSRMGPYRGEWDDRREGPNGGSHGGSHGERPRRRGFLGELFD